LKAPKATAAPYAGTDTMLPTSLGEALEALQADKVLSDAFGARFINYLVRIKQSERLRFEQAEDTEDFQRREYFSRF
jgi:glutamine synthetase